MTIYLYIKTHRVTGLKYFGFTRQDDPYKYKGSGIYWKSHIKKYGNDADTEIVGIFYNIDDAEKVALKFSKDNNIVESNEWANLMEENCRDGILFNEEIIQKIRSKNLGRKHTEDHKRKCSEVKKGKKRSKETCENISKGRKGIIFSEEQLKNMSESQKGKVLCEEHKKKISEGNKGKKKPPRSVEWKEKHSKLRKGIPNPKHSEAMKGRVVWCLKWIVTNIATGEERIIENLNAFCRENSLDRRTLGFTASGYRNIRQHKGWKCKKLKENDSNATEN